MSEQRPTETLVQKAQDGDMAAFGQLTERFGQRLAALVETRMGKEVRSRLEAGDVVQETLSRALQSIARFEFRGEDSFLQWLAGIAENLISKAATRGRRQVPLQLIDEPPASHTAPSKVMRREERRSRLLEALNALPPDYREVLRLARIEGLKHEEIARRMGRSHDAVRQLVVRGLRKLRERFGDTESLHLPKRQDEEHV